MQFIRPADLIYSIPVLGSGIFSCKLSAIQWLFSTACAHPNVVFAWLERHPTYFGLEKKRFLNYTFKLSKSQYICVIVSDDVN